MNPLLLVLLIVLCSLTPRPGRAGETKPSPGTDLKLLQGQWERELSTANTDAGLRRVIKEIKGNKETVTFFGEGDKVLRRHTVDFTLDKKGDLHVYTYSNMEVTEGDGKGTKSTNSVSYIYRADEENSFEVMGLLSGQEEMPVTVYRWKRAKK